jgi:hypothetical protein
VAGRFGIASVASGRSETGGWWGDAGTSESSEGALRATAPPGGVFDASRAGSARSSGSACRSLSRSACSFERMVSSRASTPIAVSSTLICAALGVISRESIGRPRLARGRLEDVDVAGARAPVSDGYPSQHVGSHLAVAKLGSEQASVALLRRGGESVEVLLPARWTGVEVRDYVIAAVKAAADPADHHALHAWLVGAASSSSGRSSGASLARLTTP